MKRGRPRNNQGRPNQGRKQNPNRSLESNGPGVRVRGAASTIFDKYTQLAQDATTSGDRVSAEYYYQHAEHYGRLVQVQVREREKREEEQRAAREARQAEYEARKARRNEEQGKSEPVSSGTSSEPKSEANASNEQKAQKSSKPNRAKQKQETKTDNDGQPEVIVDPMPVISPNGTVSDSEEVSAAPVRRRVRRPRATPDAAAKETAEG